MALRQALGLASRYPSHITALHVIDSPLYGMVGPDGISADTDVALRECEALEAELQREGSLNGLAFNWTVKVGSVWETISNMIDDLASDLLVVGTHGRTGIGKWVLGSVAENAFRHAPCPVLTVGSHVLGPKASSAPAKRFLVPTDLSQHSLEALPYGLALADATGGDVTLLHVRSSAPLSGEALPDSARDREQPQGQDAKQDAVHVEVGYGAPEDVIVNYANQNGTDIIVMGLHAWAANGPAMWRMAYEVVIRSTCPVLTIRDPVHSTP